MILAITSSGRERSNSEALLLSALKASNTPYTLHHLAAKRFTGCTGCGGCRRGAPGCVLRDDLTPLLEAMSGASALALAGPIYYGYLSGILKSFLDRWYGFRDGDRKLKLPEGRPLLYLLTQGHPAADAYAQMADNLDRIFTGYGFQPHRLIMAGLEGPGAALERPDLLAEAAVWGEKLGQKIAGPLK